MTNDKTVLINLYEMVSDYLLQIWKHFRKQKKEKLMFSVFDPKSLSLPTNVFDMQNGRIQDVICLFTAPLTLSSIYTHFNTMKRKDVGKHCGKS